MSLSGSEPDFPASPGVPNPGYILDNDTGIDTLNSPLELSPNRPNARPFASHETK